MSQHDFIPSEKLKDCPNCTLFGTPESPFCADCTILIDTCSECNGRRLILDHVFHQKCDRCGMPKDCTYFAKINKTVCLVCAGLIIREQTIAQKEKDDLSRITSNGEFFNAHVLSIEELKNQFLVDETIDEGQRLFAFQKSLADRIAHYKENIFNLDKEKHELTVKQKIEEKTLRDFGNELKAEIQAQLKEQDTQYQPVKPGRIVPKVVAKKLSPMDKLAQALAVAKNVSFDEAKKMIEKGNI